MAQKYLIFNAGSRAWVAAAIAGLVLGCHSSPADDDSSGDSASGDSASGADATDDGAGAPAAVQVPARTGASSNAAPAAGSAAPTPAGAATDVSGAAAPGAAAEAASAAPPVNANAANSAAATPGGGASDGADATPPAQTFEACTSNGGSYGDNCDSIYVTMKQASPALCVQLTIDNCGGYNRQGIPVDAPVSWRLSSGSIGPEASECELGVYYPDRPRVVSAEGSISWNETTRKPSEVVLDLSLSPSNAEAGGLPVDVATAVPFTPVACPN